MYGSLFWNHTKQISFVMSERMHAMLVRIGFIWSKTSDFDLCSIVVTVVVFTARAFLQSEVNNNKVRMLVHMKWDECV